MRKTLLYIAILALLVFAIYYFLFSSSDPGYNPNEAGFNTKDTAAIGRIFLATNDGETILVERTDSCWVLNKKYKALPSTLEQLMTTFTQQTALYPVTKNAYERVVKNMSTDGIKVELYDKAGKKMKVYYVGGVAVNNSGTNMLMEDAKTPYVVQVPNFTGSISGRYTTKLSDWRDRTIFNIPAEQIKSVSIKYADKPINSFEISHENNTITVKGDTNVTRHLDTLNTRRAAIYLSYFANVNCEGYLNGIEGMDSTIKNAPRQSSIDLIGIHGQHQHADIYWMALNKRSKNLTVSNPDVPDDYDGDRLYAVINDSRDTVMIQQYVFKKLFRKAYEFYQRDGTPAQQQNLKEYPKNVMMHKDH